jgi:hypothetical protein
MFPICSSREKGNGSRGCSRGSGVGVGLIVCGHGCGLDAGTQRRLGAAFHRMTRHPTEGEGQLLTLGLLEQLRCECKGLWGALFDLAILKKTSPQSAQDEARSPGARPEAQLTKFL